MTGATVGVGAILDSDKPSASLLALDTVRNGFFGGLAKERGFAAKSLGFPAIIGGSPPSFGFPAIMGGSPDEAEE